MKTITIFILFLLTVVTSLQAQVNSYSFAAANGTFSSITAGTVLGTTANDEEVFNNNVLGALAPQTDIGFPIGFNFNYNGSIFDRFAVNTNGWICLNTGTFTIGGSTTPISNIGTVGFANILSPMGRDLQGQTGSELSYKLIGSSPNRILLVQWLNYRRYSVPSGESFNFQIRLHETTNLIDFIYGTVTTTNISTSTASNTTQTGIRGASNSDFKNRTTITSWSASSDGTLNTSTMRLTTTVGPASGLTYTWSPASMTYISSTCLLTDTSNVTKNSTNNQILQIKVVVSGTASPLSLSSFTVNTTGTTNTSDISNAKIWYTGTSPVYSPITQFGTTVANPNGSYNISGTQQLTSGANYFWLSYDIPLSAVTGNDIDAGCSSLTVGTPKIPSIQAPVGNRDISSSPLTGSYSIGLSMFNLALGKDLYYKKETKKEFRDIFVNKDNSSGKKAPKDRISLGGDYQRINEEADADIYILMDGTIPYTGPQNIRVTANLRNKPGFNSLPDNINGIYPSITAAINDLNLSGVSGPVVFYLNDAMYNSETFPIILNNINGTSSANTVTIKPSIGVTSQILMPTGSAMIKIYGSSNIFIDGSNTLNGISRDLTLTSNSGNTSYCVWIGSTGNTIQNNITVKNCNLKAGENQSGSTPILVSDGDVSGNPGHFSGITIQNNFIQKGSQAVYINGGTTPQNISDVTTPQNISNVNIIDNVLNSTGLNSIVSMGIYLQGINNAVIQGNEIANIIDDQVDENKKGIWIAAGSQNITIERNKIYNIGYTATNGYGSYGIYLTPGILNAAILIKNNLIYNIYSDGYNYTDQIFFLDNPAGIALYSSSPQSGISIYNNSINLYGNTLLHTMAMSSGIFITTGSTVDLRNNAIINNLGNGDAAYGSCAVYLQGSQSQLLNSDYNNYFVNPTGSGIKAIGKISTTTTSTNISSWKTATGRDRSSLNYDPGFASITNLLPDVNNQSSWSLKGRGIQIPAVSNDYNGNLRSTSLSGGAPSIGGYEFTPSVQPLTDLVTGTISNGGTTKYIFAGDTVASITWHGGSLPTSVSVKYFSGTNAPYANTGSFGNCYWTFTPVGGSGYTFDITLYYDPAQIGTINGENNVTMANYTSNVWTHYAALLNTSLRSITQNGLNNLTVFTIDGNDNPLPVSMKYFNGTVNSSTVSLNWATTTELNNSGFEIERKSESENQWQKIGFIKGSGTTSEERVYTFNDVKLNIGKYNYRIKQLDFNGNFEYFSLSGEIIVGKPFASGMSQNYPNPSNPNTKIDYQISEDGLVKIKVFDIQGKEVMTIADGFVKAGYYTAVFDGSNLATGIYFYRLISSGYTKTMKMVLVK